MAKNSSFDIVSEIDFQEVDNAYQQARRMLTQRYDLKDSGADISFDKQKHELCISAPAAFVAKQVRDILESCLVKRGVDLKSVVWEDPQDASGASVRQKASLVCGIDKACAKKIVAEIKTLKLKVQPAIEGDKVRVTSASRDALQEVIAHVKQMDIDVPLQFGNYR